MLIEPLRIFRICYRCSNKFSLWSSAAGDRLGEFELPAAESTSAGRGAGQNGRLINTEKKVLHCCWSPTEDVVAIAGKTALYLYDMHLSMK